MLTLEPPIFIVGHSRSGTTLLRNLLSAHSRISIAPETHFLRESREYGLAQGAPDDFDAFWSMYTSKNVFKKLNIDPVHCRNLIDQQGDYTFENVFRVMLSLYCENAGKVRFGEKTPGHVHSLSYLLNWFPEARVLMMQRDPRAVVASQLQTPWVKDRLTPFSLREGIVLGKRIYETAYYATYWARITGEEYPTWRDDPRCLTVTYEALVQDVEGELRRICDFLGETFQPTMLSDQMRKADVLRTRGVNFRRSHWREWMRQHHLRSQASISTDSLSRWKGELSDIELAMIEGYCIRERFKAPYKPVVSSTGRLAGRIITRTILAAGHGEAKARRMIGSVIRKLTNISVNRSILERL